MQPPPRKKSSPCSQQPPLKAEVLSSSPFLKICLEVQPPSQQKGGGGGGGGGALGFSFHSEKFKNEKSTFNKLSALLGPSCLVKSQKIYNISAKP